MSEYECPECKQVYSAEQFSKSRFCPICEKHLRAKLTAIRANVPQRGSIFRIESVELQRDQVDAQTLFEEFARLRDFSVGEGLFYGNVRTWIAERKQAYLGFRLKFRRIDNPQKLRGDFNDFLHANKNKSWTTLYSSGIEALRHLDVLKEMLIFLQDEQTPVQERINQSLRGKKYRVEGVGISILTGLLHAFHPNIYGVWADGTLDALDVLKRKPALTSNIGNSYLLVNKELCLLEKELCTDLTTIDGFMWYIDKKVKRITE